MQVICLSDNTFVKLNSSQIVFEDFCKQAFVLVKTCWRRFQHNIFLSSKTSPRRLQDIFLQDVVMKTSWRVKNCYAEDVLKVSWKTKNVSWVSYKLPCFIILEFGNICFQRISLVVCAASYRQNFNKSEWFRKYIMFLVHYLILRCLNLESIHSKDHSLQGQLNLSDVLGPIHLWCPHGRGWEGVLKIVTSFWNL